MEENDVKFLGCLGWLAGLIGAMILNVILSGWALSTVWGWFIVPVFGLPQIGILQAAGIALVVSYLTKDIYLEDNSKMTKGERVVYLFGIALFRPVFTVALGWAITQFMA